MSKRFQLRPETVDLIIDKLNLSMTIHDPACGDGHILKRINERFDKSGIVFNTIGSDINPKYPYRKYDYTENIVQENVDYTISKPPKDKVVEFLDIALRHTRQQVIFMVNMADMATVKKLLSYPELKYIYVHKERQHPIIDGCKSDDLGNEYRSVFDFGWFVFEQHYNEETIVELL